MCCVSCINDRIVCKEIGINLPALLYKQNVGPCVDERITLLTYLLLFGLNNA